MPTGKLKRFTPDKGFGFIGADDGGEDIFAHTQQFTGDLESLRGGERVIFESELDEKRGKVRASSWSIDPSGGGSDAIMSFGKLKKNFAEKGFAFISPDDGGEDLFSHHKQFMGGGDPGQLAEGVAVKFEVEFDSKKGRNKAGSWMLADGSSAPGGGIGGSGQPQGACMGGMQGCGQPQGYGAPMGYGGYGAPMAGAMSGYGGMPCGGCGGMPGCGGAPMGQPMGGYGPCMGGCPTQQSSPYGAPQQAGYNQPMPGYGLTPATGGAAPLPPGWEQQTDPTSGKPYWCNRSTGESSWTPPAAPAPAPAPAPVPAAGPALPQGWETATDPSSGKIYYFNRGTGETKWEPPA